MVTDATPYDPEIPALPAVLLLAEPAETVEVTGHFDAAKQTWSNRRFECAATKKHNEAM